METPITKRMLKQHPKADAYLKNLEYFSCRTFNRHRIKEIETSTTLSICSEEIPDEDIVKDLYAWCDEIAAYMDIQEFLLEFAITNDEGNTSHVTLFDSSGYMIREIAKCGQKIFLFFDSYMDYKTLYPLILKIDSINQEFPEMISEERQDLRVTNTPLPKEYKCKFIKTSDILVSNDVLVDEDRRQSNR